MKKKTLYFHVGHKKTGSSAIQAFLALNQNTLTDKGVYYPGQTTFFQPFQTSSGNCTELLPLMKANKFDEMRQIIDKQFEGCSKVLYSNEMLLDFFQKEVLFEKFVHALQSYDLKIIIYIRNQVDFTNSLYNQLVKNHDWTKEIDGDICPDYPTLILRLGKYLSKESILIRPYEKEQFAGGDVFHDFLACLDIKYSDEFKLPDKVINPSLSAKTLQYRVLANRTKLDEYSIAQKNRLNQMLGEFTVLKEGGKAAPMLLDEKRQEKIRQQFTAGNERIAKEFLKRENTPLFLNNKNKPSKPSVLTIDDCLSISEFILEKSNAPDIEQKVKGYLVSGILKEIGENVYADGFCLQEKLLDIPFTKHQKLVTKPLRVSKSISKIIKDGQRLVFEASAADPWFQMRRLFGSYGKKIMVRVEAEFPEVCEFKVYYKGKKQSFSEEFSEVIWVGSGFSRHVMIIESPFDVKALRFDPGDNAGRYIIHKLDVLF